MIQMRLIDADEAFEIARTAHKDFAQSMADLTSLREVLEDAHTVDAVPVDAIAEKIIVKKAEVSEYWIDDVKQYRATQGYSDIEHDVDNFLRGYNEAVEDMLAILDSERKDGDLDGIS